MANQRNRPPVRIVCGQEEAEALCEELLQQEYVSCDSEWYAFDRDRTPVHNGLALCWTFCWRDEDGDLQLVYLHNHGDSAGLARALLPFWQSPTNNIIGHNVNVDAHILANEGISSAAFDVDTLMLDVLLDENRENKHGLKECVEDHLGVTRVGFAQTFGVPQLKKNGEPYASGALIVPKLDEYLAGHELPTQDWTALCRQAASDAKAGGELTSAQRWHTLIEYATDDAWDTLVLFEIFRDRMIAIPWINGKTYWDYYLEVERPVTAVIQKMERRGMYLDVPFLHEMREIATEQQDVLAARILEAVDCPMNLSSSQQIGKLIYGQGPQAVGTGKRQFTIQGLGFPIFRFTDAKQPSAAADAIAELKTWAHRTKREWPSVLDDIIQWSKQAKQLGTYLVAMSERQHNNRIHGRVSQGGTVSGRFSMSQPNLQNQSSGNKDVFHIRDCFIAPPGHTLVIADWSQLEYRLLAHTSQEPKLLEMFIRGWDMHSLTTYNVFHDVKAEVDQRFGGMTTESMKWVAEEFGDHRKKAKVLNFEIIYGVGHKKLADQLSIPEEEAQRMIDSWFRGYPYVKAWMNRKLAEYRDKGHCRMIDGRYRRAVMWKLTHKNRGMRGEEERSLINGLIQGSAAAMAKKAMILINADDGFKRSKSHLTVQVHDELVFEVPIPEVKRVIPIIRRHMEQPFSKPLRVPMPVAIGYGCSWGSAKV